MKMVVVMMKVIVVMIKMIVVMMAVTRSEVRLLCISQCLVTRSVPEPDLHIAPVHFPTVELFPAPVLPTQIMQQSEKSGAFSTGLVFEGGLSAALLGSFFSFLLSPFLLRDLLSLSTCFQVSSCLPLRLPIDSLSEERRRKSPGDRDATVAILNRQVGAGRCQVTLEVIEASWRRAQQLTRAAAGWKGGAQLAGGQAAALEVALRRKK